MEMRVKVMRNRETDRKTIRTGIRRKKQTKRRMEFYREYVWENVEM